MQSAGIETPAAICRSLTVSVNVDGRSKKTGDGLGDEFSCMVQPASLPGGDPSAWCEPRYVESLAGWQLLSLGDLA